MTLPPIDPTGRPMIFAKPGRVVEWSPVAMTPDPDGPEAQLADDRGAELLDRWKIASSLPPDAFFRQVGTHRYALAWDQLGVGIPERVVLVDDETSLRYPSNDFAAEAVARVSYEGAMYVSGLVVAGIEPEAVAALPHRVVVLMLVGAFPGTAAGRRLELAGGARSDGGRSGVIQS